MSKFANAPQRQPVGAMSTVGNPAFAPAPRTHEGDVGFAKDAKTELFTLAASSLLTDKFYESADEQQARIVSLVSLVSQADPVWVANFARWLRDEGNIRSASIVVAATYAKVSLDGLLPEGAPPARGVVRSVLSRADEPMEMLGYWLHTYGSPIPKPIKRGVADAATKLYNEYAALKYNGRADHYPMGRVINLTHPSPQGEWQSHLFRYVLDAHHRGVAEAEVPEVLATIRAARDLENTPEGERRDLLRRNVEALGAAGFTWERLSGWLPGGMDAEAWEAVIPHMGYMALLRNLRNFVEAGVAPAVLDRVGDILKDPERVAKSRQFPYRFWMAYKHSGTVEFSLPLERALEAAVPNIPSLKGSTLVMIDDSGSMHSQWRYGGYGSKGPRESKVTPAEKAALFGFGLAMRAEKADVYGFSNHARRANVATSLLRNVEAFMANKLGQATYTWSCTAEVYRGHDRVIILGDQQDHPGDGRSRGRIPTGVPIYVWDMGGYQTANIQTGPGNYLFGGFTDACFRQIPLLESGRTGSWPWDDNQG
jgi:hypothetical protein